MWPQHRTPHLRCLHLSALLFPSVAAHGCVVCCSMSWRGCTWLCCVLQHVLAWLHMAVLCVAAWCCALQHVLAWLHMAVLCVAACPGVAAHGCVVCCSMSWRGCSWLCCVLQHVLAAFRTMRVISMVFELVMETSSLTITIATEQGEGLQHADKAFGPTHVTRWRPCRPPRPPRPAPPRPARTALPRLASPSPALHPPLTYLPPPRPTCLATACLATALPRPVPPCIPP